MDTAELKHELEVECSNLIGIDDDTSDEYKKTINNVHKLSQVVSQQEDLNLKKEKNDSDNKYRDAQLKFEKKKHADEMSERQADRDLDRERMEQQHRERMAELKINQIKAENEQAILEQQKKKSSREFWLNLAEKVFIFGAKAFGTYLIVRTNVRLHANEIYCERHDNGMVPNKCKVYAANMDKMAEGFMK